MPGGIGNAEGVVAGVVAFDGLSGGGRCRGDLWRGVKTMRPSASY